MTTPHDWAEKHGMGTTKILRKAQSPRDGDRVAVVTTREQVGLRTIAHGVYLHDLGLDQQVPHGTPYFCTDQKGRFQAWRIIARIKIAGLQHPIPGTGKKILDDRIAQALAALSGTMMGSGADRRLFEDHWPAPAELFLLDTSAPLPDVDFMLDWNGGNRTMGSCDLGDLRRITRAGRKLGKIGEDLPSWRSAPRRH